MNITYAVSFQGNGFQLPIVNKSVFVYEINIVL